MFYCHDITDYHIAFGKSSVIAVACVVLACKDRITNSKHLPTFLRCHIFSSASPSCLPGFRWDLCKSDEQESSAITTYCSNQQTMTTASF